MTIPDYNIDYDPEHYDLECEYVGPGEEDILFLRQLCADFGGPVLEICVGTGRVAIPLAYDGLKITGVDRDEGMLDRCREKLTIAPPEVRKRVSLVNADMREFSLEKKFRTAFIAFNSFLAMTTRDDQLACLARIKEHLQPSRGRFILDIFNPNLEYLTRSPGTKNQEYLFIDDSTGIIHEQLSSVKYDEASQVYSIVLDRNWTLPDGSVKRRIRKLDLKMIFPDELLLLLDHSGFKVLHRWGNYRKEDFRSGMGKQLIVAKPV